MGYQIPGGGNINENREHMKIKVSVVEKKFGATIVAPICDKAHRFCALLGIEYLTQEQLVHITKLGFELEVVQ